MRKYLAIPVAAFALALAASPASAFVDKDCSDFSTQAQAQHFFNSHGGSPTNNYDALDGDGDGRVCESLPG